MTPGIGHFSIWHRGVKPFILTPSPTIYLYCGPLFVCIAFAPGLSPVMVLE